MNDSIAVPGAESPQLQRLGIAATEDFRQSVRTALSFAFGAFLKQFGNFLVQSWEKSLTPDDKQLYHALARSIKTEHSQWLESFIQHVDAHLIGGSVPERSGGQPTAADESIALANIELRAEARYQKRVTELDARVNRVRLVLYVPVFTKALAPAGLSRALQDTADALVWPPKQRRMLFEKFDALLVPELETVYTSLIEALTRIGNDAVKAVAETPQSAPSASPTATAPPAKRTKKPATQMQPPPHPPKVDADTQAMLQSYALKSDGSGYTDGLLAADLLALADNRPLPGVAQNQTWVPLQRITLAGHFLNEVIDDPMVPDELKPQHESMRYPLVKSALTDETLFTSLSHPLGSMVNELLLKAATSRVTGNVETRRMAELLQQLLVQFDLSPEFVRQSMHTNGPLEESQIQRFFELQRLQAQQRRDFVMGEAKRVVARQIEHLTFGRDTPEPAMKFLNLAWSPVMTKRLLQHGAVHAVSKAAVTLMEQLLDQLDVRDPEDQASAEWKDVSMTMIKALIAEGMPPNQVKIALELLESARKSPRENVL